MRNDPKVIARLRVAIRSAFPLEGDLDLLAFDAGLDQDWINFKSTSPQLDLALNRLIQRAEANRQLVEFLNTAREKNSKDPELQKVVEQLLQPIQEPLNALGAKLGDFESVLFQDAGFADVARWIDTLSVVRHAVCMIQPDPTTKVGCGTGFLVGPDLVLTNWHVAGPFWAQDDKASKVAVHFDYEKDSKGIERPATRPCRLKRDWNLPNSPVMQSDFALLRLDRRAADDAVDGKSRGFLSLTGKTEEELAQTLERGSPLLILQHPQAEPLKLALGSADRIEASRYVWYGVNTEPGSSGSPCFSQRLEVVGVHHYGTDLKNRGVLASAIEPSIRDSVKTAPENIQEHGQPESIPNPLIPDMSNPSKTTLKKRALIIQPEDKPAGLARLRREKVWTDLIQPALQDTDYEPVRLQDVDCEDVLEPIVSPLSTDPLVIADLGGLPWDPKVMIGVGFRIATGKPMVLIADEPQPGARRPTYLDEQEVLWIDTEDIPKSQGELRHRILEFRSPAGSSWSSQYPYVDFQMPLDHPSEAVYTNANDAAARLYGLTRAEELIGKRVEEFDNRLYLWMPEPHRTEFVDEQVFLLGTILWPERLKNHGDRKTLSATVRIPLWLANRDDDEFRNKIYLPLLVQHKIHTRQGVVLMRTVFVDISSWSAPGLSGRPKSSLLTIPDIFRRSRELELDVFLPCDSPDSGYLRNLRDLLESFDCTVWFKSTGAETAEVSPDDLIQKLYRSRLAAIPIGRKGMGKWEGRPKVREALQAYLRAGYPHVLLILPEIDPPDSWKDFVPADYAPLVAQSLSLPLPSLGTPPGSAFLDRIIRELLKDFKQQ
jgi:V8-like Glu-specific endopeptidase/PAS domain-containing protein